MVVDIKLCRPCTSFFWEIETNSKVSACGSWVLWLVGAGVVDGERAVIEAVVVVSVEEVGPLVGPDHGGTDPAGQLPVGDVPGIGPAHRRPVGWVELPVLAALEEVDLPVASPHKS